MIDVKTAVAKAAEYVGEFPSYLPAANMRLEETELADGYWLITLSFEDNRTPIIGRRIYKLFRIDGESGKILSMKERLLTPVQ